MKCYAWKGLLLVGALSCLLAFAVPAGAAICNIDVTPAATLLLPYFEVDLGNLSGMTTLMSINNSSANAVLAHLIIWTDLSVPVIDINIYLTGYDIQTLNLRDILVNGNLPQTASTGQDPFDTISPKGPKSMDSNFPSCSGQLPPPPLPASFIQHLQLSLTGKASPLFGGLCSGRNLGDNVARGYITVDTVNNCTLRLPSDPGYFSSDITFQNVLWGDYVYQNVGQGSATGGALVHVEASLTNPATTTAGRYTFYGRYNGWNASDHREPLATTFGGRYFNGGGFGGNTSFVVWRDSKTSQNAFTCPAISGRPSWFPLGVEGIDIFDEQEHVSVPLTSPFSPQPPGPAIVPFPAEAQRTKINGPDLPVPFSFGWIFLDLNTTVVGNPNPPFDPAAAQAWMIYDMDANGLFSVGFEGLRLDSACAPNHTVP
ncbi:MAG TPA: hypothetical protein VLV54_18320 [Thermoanaerobaculia bacterium]|nr:hypothetical protein [Thermoanaerobaculia bacterium]